MSAAVVCTVFFLSGASALVFETLWFRGAGLMLGNSVWASSVVMTSFMAGLGLGNYLAGRTADRSVRPLRVYALLEAVIGASGLGLVLLFPALPALAAPVLRPLTDSPLALNAVRLAIAFGLMLLPAVAMGATLPVLVRALAATEGDFGRVVGRLYGWNTLGAVAGAILGETVFVEHWGMRGAGAAAAALNVAAAAGALALSRRGAVEQGSAAVREETGAPCRRSARGLAPLLLAACLAGGLLLALEVLWFRFLVMFAFGTSLVFAIMLATVLLGIGLGGLGTSLWLRLHPDAERLTSVVAAFAGMAVIFTYSAFSRVLGAGPPNAHAGYEGGLAFFALAAWLMLPTSLCSGVLFTLLGKRVKGEMSGTARPAAALTLANTFGAMAGAVLGAFVLLPQLGLERSFCAVACGYGAVAVAAWLGRDRSGPGRADAWAAGSAGLALTAAAALFPFGLMRNHFVPIVAGAWSDGGASIAAMREGVTETMVYLRTTLWDEQVHVRLVTNGFSMAASTFKSRRYMNLFVYLPVALRPAPRRALLISYGIGSTAKALTDTADLEAIDVVDISRDILEMGRIVFPPPDRYSLDDPRVRVHVEDGRFFLLASTQRYDLITAEPPPPKAAGVGNLYSKEYFQLVHARLAQGGVISHWLPVYQLEPSESEAVIRGFCDVFDDCSLWTGSGLEWILLGTRGARGPDRDGFSRQWRDPVVAPMLRDLALETPEQLGALFVADAADLRRMTQRTPPLDDDHPRRISPRLPPGAGDRSYATYMEAMRARERFAASAFVRRMWPAELRQGSLDAFRWQKLLNETMAPWSPKPALRDLAECLTQTSLRTLVLQVFGTTAREIEIATRAAARGVPDPMVHELLGIDALADRRYAAAAERFAAARPGPAAAEGIAKARVLASCLAGDERAAREALDAARRITRKDVADWRWLADSCGLPPIEP